MRGSKADGSFATTSAGYHTQQIWDDVPGQRGVVTDSLPAPLRLQARDYTEDKAAGRALARGDVPFLFRAFEAGQVGSRIRVPTRLSSVLVASY